MKNKYQISALLLSLVLLFTVSTTLNAQKMFRKLPAVKAFHRGSFLVGISEGTTIAVYTTKQRSESFGTPNLVKRGLNEGCRDPLFIEYGISNHWGLGLSSGKDIFSVSPSDYYGFTVSNNAPIKISTGEFTFDAAYHVFANKRLDLSVFNSIGCFSVNFQGQDGDANPYKYTANGKIWRFGTKVRYYFFRHLGAVGMLSYYAAHASPKNVKDNTVASNYNTNISGYAIEIGLCYRFFR